jgi:hypothetical protein
MKREQYQSASDECEVCGARSTAITRPDGYSSSFLQCCPSCAGVTARERVARYLRRMELRFGTRVSRTG